MTKQLIKFCILILVYLVNSCHAGCSEEEKGRLYEWSACPYQFEEDVEYYGKECCVFARLEHCLRLEDEKNECYEVIQDILFNKTTGTKCGQNWKDYRFSDKASAIFMPSKCLFFFFWKQLIIDAFMLVFLIILISYAGYNYWKNRRRKRSSPPTVVKSV